jgi:hypothetical protein
VKTKKATKQILISFYKKHIMKAKEVLNEVKKLLGIEVNLEQMMLEDGVTVLEAEAFEAEQEVFIVTEDEQKIPLPIGEYKMDNGFMLTVEVEGIIASYMEAAAEEEVVEEAPEEEVPVEAEAEVKTPKSIIESVSKETRFSAEEFEALKAEVVALKAQLETKEVVEEKVELEVVTPINYNPEAEATKVNFKYGQNREMSTLDRVMSKINS